MLSTREVFNGSVFTTITADKTAQLPPKFCRKRRNMNKFPRKDFPDLSVFLFMNFGNQQTALQLILEFLLQ